MQLYSVTFRFTSEGVQNTAYSKLIEYIESGAEADRALGFELITRVHCPQVGSGVVICKAKSGIELLKHFAPWRAMFGVEFDMQPAFTDKEMCECHKELWESLAR